MAVIDLDGLLKEVSADSPCGENLEYDPAFGALARAATGRPEQQMGENVIAAVEPDWGEVQRLSGEMFGRTKDLRVAVTMTRALVHSDGFRGLGDGMALIRGLLDRYWGDVHPRLDAQDNDDPTFRMNALSELGDRDGIVRSLRAYPLASSRRAGRFSLRDIEIANGVLPRPAGDESPAPQMSVIEGCFMETELADLEGAATGIQRAMDDLTAVESLLVEKVGAARTPDLMALRATLKSTQQILGGQLARRGSTVATGDGEGGTMTDGTSSAAVTGEITSREGVIRLLDKACEYYARHEPSSPVPLLLQRAKRLVSKDFVEAIRDIAPGGLSEVQAIGGLDKEE